MHFCTLLSHFFFILFIPDTNPVVSTVSMRSPSRMMVPTFTLPSDTHIMSRNHSTGGTALLNYEFTGDGNRFVENLRNQALAEVD